MLIINQLITKGIALYHFDHRVASIHNGFSSSFPALGMAILVGIPMYHLCDDQWIDGDVINRENLAMCFLGRVLYSHHMVKLGNMVGSC